ncbi:unnamed protein product [Boreogadus saida]
MNGKAVERGQVRSGTLSPCYSITQLSPHPPSPQDMPHQSAESSLKKSPVPVPGECRSVPQLRVMGRGPGRRGEGLRSQGPLIFLSPLFLTPDPGLSGGWLYRGCGLLPGFMRYDHSAETQHPRAPCHPQEDTLGVDVGGGQSSVIPRPGLGQTPAGLRGLSVGLGGARLLQEATEPLPSSRRGEWAPNEAVYAHAVAPCQPRHSPVRALPKVFLLWALARHSQVNSVNKLELSVTQLNKTVALPCLSLSPLLTG